MANYAEKFNDLITRLQVVLQNIDHIRNTCVQAGKMECLLLNYLYNNTNKQQITMNELAQVLGVSHSRITRIMDNLVDKDLVEREHPRGKEDRRCLYAVITDKGKRIAENSQQTVFSQQEKLIKKIDPKEIDEMYKYFAKYITLYEKLLAETLVEV